MPFSPIQKNLSTIVRHRQFSPDARARATEAVYQYMRTNARSIDRGNFSNLCSSDLGLLFQINDVIEKPNIKNAPSNYAIIGRYILPVDILNEIKKLKPSQGGEIHITDAIRNLIYNGNKFFGNIFKGKYLDCGTINGYIKSGIQIFKGN